MTDRELIEERCQSEGLNILGWVETEDGTTALLGRCVVTDSREDDGLYAEDEGELTACVVGAEQYGNRRVSFTFTLDGNDEGNEVRDLHVVEPV